MTTRLILTKQDKVGITAAIHRAATWSRTHGWETGLAEIALGGAAVAYAIQSGVIGMGVDVVATALHRWSATSLIGAAVGGAVGGTAGSVLGSVGVAAMGGAIGIPAGLLVGGGALLFAAAGYTVGDAVHNFLAPDFSELVAGGALLTVGVALIVDGARRVLGDPRVQAKVTETAVELGCLSTRVIARTKEELRHLATEPFSLSTLTNGIGLITSVGGMAAIGGSASVASVSVLGSHALGAAALSLGLISAPIWPVVAGGVAGAGVWYGFRAVRHGPRNPPA
jgi:hypothetical protein